MAELIERLEKMEAYIKVFSEEKMDSKMQIKLLETRLVKSEQRIQELEQGQEKLREEAKFGFKKSELKKTDRRSSDVERQQQQLHEKVRENPSEEVRCGFKKGEFKRMKQRIAHLERQQQQLEEQTQDVSYKFERLDKLQTVLNSIVLKKQQTDSNDLRLSPGLATHCGDSQSNVTDVSERLQKIFEDLQKVKDQVDKDNTAIHRMRIHQDTMENSTFRVSLEQGTELNIQTHTHLDLCESIFLASPCFDKDTSFFTAPTDGVYLFNVTVVQEGCGELVVYVGSEDGKYHTVACPYINGKWKDLTRDVRSGSVLLSLFKDRRVGVFAKPFSGQPSVLWCKFSGCLLSSST